MERVDLNALACRAIVADDGWFASGHPEASWGQVAPPFGIRIILQNAVGHRVHGGKH
jgi:hypothetical protein